MPRTFAGRGAGSAGDPDVCPVIATLIRAVKTTSGAADRGKSSANVRTVRA
jgi:hypothetical protein